MSAQQSVASKRCCIVVANDERSERLSGSLDQYALSTRPAAAVTMGFLRLAARRARKLASPANVLVCAQEADRRTWEGPFWFTRHANRFISDRDTPISLSTAGALLSIATKDPSCLIAVLPSEFWVARESVLIEAIEKSFSQMHLMPESVATLGMIDSHHAGHEDYLVVGPNNVQKGAVIQARVNRPETRLAKQLTTEGAMVASGILLGYAQAFAARINKYWPHLARELIRTVESDCLPGAERKFSTDSFQQIPRSVMNSIRLSPPTFPMRAFRVQGSGWCSRKVGEL
jgi:mannose-1-phosphate guanylyltransferase